MTPAAERPNFPLCLLDFYAVVCRKCDNLIAATASPRPLALQGFRVIFMLGAIGTRAAFLNITLGLDTSGTKSYSPTPCRTRKVSDFVPPLVTRCGRAGLTT